MEWIIFGVLLFGFFVEIGLGYLNLKHFLNPLPSELEDIYTAEELEKARGYSKDQFNLGLVDGLKSLVFWAVIIFGGILNQLYEFSFDWLEDEFTAGVWTLGVLFLVNWIMDIPLSYYTQFKLEKKYEQSNYTLNLFISDAFKRLLITLLLGGGLLWLFGAIYELLGTYFWLYFWGVMFLVSVVANLIYIPFILPLFNKLSPLPEGELRNEIESFCSKVGFEVSRLFQMDGSKRSAKANAFFSGLGTNKTIVLFDTLIDKTSKEEITAVLAHEVGHYKKKHTLVNLVLGAFQMLFTLWILGLAINEPLLTAGLGMEKHNIYIALVGFSILYSPVSMLIGWFTNMASRKMEYQADRYAKEHYSGEELISALKKLSINNLSNINPHPAFVGLFHSHPALVDRIKALKTNKE